MHDDPETKSYLIISRSFERTTPIWFAKLITRENLGEKFLDQRRMILEMASTNCLLDIIHIGRRVTAENLAEHHSYFEDKLVGLSTRLPEIYSGYRLIAFEVTADGLTHRFLFIVSFLLLEWHMSLAYNLHIYRL